MRDKFFAQKYSRRLHLIIHEAVIILTKSYLDWPSEKQRDIAIFDVFIATIFSLINEMRWLIFRVC